MAMTKAEQAEMEALRTKLALRWSGMAAPERLRPPLFGAEPVLGWDFNPYIAGPAAVFEAWTKSVSHGRGHDPSQSGSKNARPLYATKHEALVALRLAKEEEFAGALRAIDVLIESEP